MGFLSEGVIAAGLGGQVYLDRDQWSALSWFLMPETDQHGQPLPGEEWKHHVTQSALHEESFPIRFTEEQSRIFADAMEFYSASIPEREEIGEVLDTVDREIDGQWKKYAVTSSKGWLETDDVEIVFLEDGKQIIRDLIALCRKGPVTVNLESSDDFVTPRPPAKVMPMKARTRGRSTP